MPTQRSSTGNGVYDWNRVGVNLKPDPFIPQNQLPNGCGWPTLIYDGQVEYHDDLVTGHFVLLRGDVKLGKRVKVGSYTSIEGTATVGDDTVIRGHSEIPSCVIGSRVQIYAWCCMYDTPNLMTGELKPPVIEDDVTLSCNARILGGITVGARSFVCAHAFVQTDIPPDSYVKYDGTFVPLRKP